MIQNLNGIRINPQKMRDYNFIRKNPEKGEYNGLKWSYFQKIVIKTVEPIY